jgi:hypothetical protein
MKIAEVSMATASVAKKISERATIRRYQLSRQQPQE